MNNRQKKKFMKKNMIKLKKIHPNDIKKNAIELRAELKVYDDFMVDKEEFDKVIEAFANIPEKYIVPYDSLLYASSAWKEGEA